MSNSLKGIVAEKTNWEITFVTPGALMSIPMGHEIAPIVCRRHFAGAAIILDTEDGLLREVQGRSPPVPWYSKEERRAALNAIAADRWLNEETRQQLLAHVRSTPFYRWEECRPAA